MVRSHLHVFIISIAVCGAVFVRNQIEENLNSVASAQVAVLLGAFSDGLLDEHSPGDDNIPEAMNAISSKMDLKSAVRATVSQQLPQDVSNLVQVVGDSDGDAVVAPEKAVFNESSLEKARVALNDLVEKAWRELDDKIIRCKGFQDMNRHTYGQVTRDVSRLLEQINDLERIEAQAIEGIASQEQQITDLEDLIEKETGEYNAKYAVNKGELITRQNDLDVFQFILTVTKCPGATSFAQFESRVCETRSGRKTILFSDAGTAEKYNSILTPSAKRKLDQLLRLLQQPISTTSPSPPQDQAPVQGEDGRPCLGGAGASAGMGSEDVCMKSCGPLPPDCGLLHDKMSLMWGVYKDQVDSLTMDMMRFQMDFEELKANLNEQMSIFVASKAKFVELLAEARANLAGDRTQLKLKYTEKAKLNRQYYSYMTQCKKRIQWIMYQDMCAIKVVRNAVLESSTQCKAELIQDCELNAWVPGSCNVPCDDTCDAKQPFKCGGWAKMTRSVVTQPDACGIKCPQFTRYIRCGQYKCPVDCQMSAWSGWSACTAECGGGLRSKTRSIRVKPKNGGGTCNTNEESEACATGSCDRNCKLQRWTKWTPCSVACGGGLQYSKRHVLIPTRGAGKCPKDHSRLRWKDKTCNTHSCNGDEICIAKQDLVIAVDSSGSVNKDGFAIMVNYTSTLLARYQMEYFGEKAMRIGVVLFGNGIIMADGKTISPALNRQKLTSTMADVKTAVTGLPYKKGFTNMAQAFSMAEDMFIKGSRRSAQQSVMVITDGKPSFVFMTDEMVHQLDDKGILRYFVAVNNQGAKSDTMMQLREWASSPWETNMIHIPGLAMMESDTDLWVEKALTKFCPEAYSPSTALWEEKTYGFEHVKDSGWCENRKRFLGRADSAEACAALASGVGAESFMFGVWYRRGYCFSGTMKVDKAQYAAWGSEKVRPRCASGWRSSMLFDFYAMEPVG